MKTEKIDNKMIVYPVGRIDSANAQQFTDELKAVSNECGNNPIEINMENLDYISSAGLRVFLQLKKSGVEFKLTEVSSKLYELFEMTGFSEIFDISKALRRVSIDGCKILGSGFSSTVYRIDPETIVKVYNSSHSIPMMIKEQQNAKQAFIKGIPTAISYDLVKVGDRYGSVFELLDAKSFNDIIIEEPEKTDEIIALYVDFLKKIHATKMDHGSLPSSIEKYRNFLNIIRKHLTDEQYLALDKYLSEFPEDDHFVHGDFQMKNVMMVNGEPMLIDMDTPSVGHPIFDLAPLYVAYYSFAEDEPDNPMNFLGISCETSHYIWDSIARLYLNGRSEDEISDICNKIQLTASIYFLGIIEISDLKNNEYAEIRIRHNKEHIRDLLEKVDSLYF